MVSDELFRGHGVEYGTEAPGVRITTYKERVFVGKDRRTHAE